MIIQVIGDRCSIMKAKLNSKEQKIEREAEKYRPISKKKLQKVQSIIRRMKKRKNSLKRP